MPMVFWRGDLTFYSDYSFRISKYISVISSAVRMTHWSVVFKSVTLEEWWGWGWGWGEILNYKRPKSAVVNTAEYLCSLFLVSFSLGLFAFRDTLLLIRNSPRRMGRVIQVRRRKGRGN